MTSGRYVMTARICADQRKHKDFEVPDNRSPGNFVLVSGFEALSLPVCTASQIYLHCAMEDNKKRVEMLHQWEVQISAY